MALGQALRQGRKRHPDKRALIFEQQSWTYAQLDEITDRIAASLLRLGIRPGDRVALHFTNCPEMVSCYYACFKIGAVAVPLNTRFKGPELEYVLNHSGPRVFVGQESLFSEVEGVRPRLASVERFYLAGDGGAFPAARSFEQMLAPADKGVAFPSVADEALAVILYTSGTTARPKGVVHSHHSLERTIVWSTMQEADAAGIAMPMCHVGGTVQLLAAISRGAGVVIIPGFDPQLILHALAAHRVTRFGGLPVMHNTLLSCPDPQAYDLSALKYCAAGGDAVPVEMQLRFEERFGVVMIEACGMTEMPIYSLNPPTARRLGSIGLPVPGARLRLADDLGSDVPPGEVGEILVQSEAVMVGYWRDPQATAAAVRDGWLHTGDLARCDEDGYYWFVGRKKEIIIRGGSNISLVEVEAVLYQHPAVRESGVVGAPDAEWGEVVHAFVSLREGAAVSEEELRQFAGERLAAYKVPAAIHFLAELPKGVTGKVHRKTLREWAEGCLA